MKSVLPAASSVSLTSDIWSGNAKEDYVSVVAHYVNSLTSFLMMKELVVVGL